MAPGWHPSHGPPDHGRDPTGAGPVQRLAAGIGVAAVAFVTGSGRPLRWAEIESYLCEVGDELNARGVARTIIVVGGAYVAHRGVRTTTTDVDALYEIDEELRSAVATVAVRHDLEADWLNDRARPWRPATFDLAGCEVALTHGGLTVLLPPVDVVVLMKIAVGGRTPNDALDLRALWPSSTFSSPHDAVAAFYIAYPHEEDDAHLHDWIASVIGNG